jgi:hypothetical protein
MRFSMNSYLLGVGTVVGALALGFGGGILLSNTAMKDTPAGPSRIERVARQEPAPAQVQVTEARAVPVPRADPAPAVQQVAEPTPQVQAAAQPTSVPETKPVAEVTRPEPAKAAEPVRQVEAPRQVERQAERQAEQSVKQADAPTQIEQKEAGQGARELRRAEREQRRAERRIERERQVAERKARSMEYARIRQRPIEIQEEQPARPELAFEREEPRHNLFEGLFGRPLDPAPGERE